MTVFVDSDVLIAVSRGRDSKIVSAWTALSNADTLILYSPVSVAELWAGARPGEHAVLNNLFRNLTCVPIGEEIGHSAGLYLSRYRKSHGVEIADALIAASALAIKADLWTRNRKHYPMEGMSFYQGDR